MAGRESAQTAPQGAPEGKSCLGRLPLLELEGVDPLSARVFQQFMKTLHLHRQLVFNTLAKNGTHPVQAFCLRVIAANDGINQSELARTLHLSRPRVTTVLQGLERDGLIARRPDTADQRSTRVFATAAGRTRDKELQAMTAAHVGESFGALPETDRLELERILGRLAELVEAVVQKERSRR